MTHPATNSKLKSVVINSFRILQTLHVYNHHYMYRFSFFSHLFEVLLQILITCLAHACRKCFWQKTKTIFIYYQLICKQIKISNVILKPILLWVFFQAIGSAKHSILILFKWNVKYRYESIYDPIVKCDIKNVL